MINKDRLYGIIILVGVCILFGFQFGLLFLNLSNGKGMLSIINMLGMTVLCYPIRSLIKYIMES